MQYASASYANKRNFAGLLVCLDDDVDYKFIRNTNVCTFNIFGAFSSAIPCFPEKSFRFYENKSNNNNNNNNNNAALRYRETKSQLRRRESRVL